MAGKTKTQRILDEAEAIIRAEAERIEAEWNDLTLTLPALRQAVEDAEDGLGPVAEVWDRIDSGETISPSDLVTAEAEEKINKRLLSAKANRKNVLERSRPVETVTLAERTADALRSVMQGFDVLVTRAPVKSWTFPDNATAIVVVAEPGIERDRFTGLISGAVTVLMHRPGLYRPINIEALEAEAERQRLALTVQSNIVGDESGWQAVAGPAGKTADPNAYVVDRLTVRLTNVIDEYAVIGRVDLSGLHTRTWAEEVFRSNGSHPVGIPGTDKPWLWGIDIGGHTVAHGMRAEIVSETVDEHRVRTLVVRQVLHTFNTHPGDFSAGLGEAMRIDRGVTYLGLGTLTDSEVKAGNQQHDRQIANWSITLTFESKTA
jgi:hypothetical protein